MWRKSRADFPFCRSFGIVHPLMRKKKKNLSEENRSFFVSIFPQKRKTKLQTCMLLIDWQSWQCVIQSQQCADRALNCVCMCVCMPHGRNKLCTKNEFIRGNKISALFECGCGCQSKTPPGLKEIGGKHEQNGIQMKTFWNVHCLCHFMHFQAAEATFNPKTVGTNLTLCHARHPRMLRGQPVSHEGWLATSKVLVAE